MIRSKKLKNLTLLSLATVMSCGAQNVFAHAGLRDSNISEGTVSTWNGLKVTHGCNTNIGGEANGQPHKDVIALSYIIPNSTDISKVIIRRGKINSETLTTGQEPTLTDLSKDMIGSTATLGLSASITPVMSGSGTMFINNKPIVDANGTLRGLQSWAGSKPFNGPVLLESYKKPDGNDLSTTGVAEFSLSKFQFKPTSCVKSLKVRFAAANWCLKGKKSYNQADRADIWIGSKTTLFNDDVVMPGENSTPIFWPTLSINRDLILNPLPGTTSTYPSSTVPPDADSGPTNVNGVITTKYAKNNSDPNLAGKIIVDDTNNSVKTTNDTLKGQTTVENYKTACTTSDYDTVYIEPSNDDIDALLPISKEKYPAGAADLYWPTAVK